MRRRGVGSAVQPVALPGLLGSLRNDRSCIGEQETYFCFQSRELYLRLFKDHSQYAVTREVSAWAQHHDVLLLFTI